MVNNISSYPRVARLVQNLRLVGFDSSLAVDGELVTLTIRRTQRIIY